MAKILVADSCTQARDIISSALESAGHDVLCTGLPDGALDMFEEFSPDLTLLNVLMDEDEGIYITESIKNMDCKARVIICSVIADEFLERKVTCAGACYHVQEHDWSSPEFIQWINTEVS